MTPIRIFISSVQREFAEERAMLSSYIRGDALLGKFFEAFVLKNRPLSRLRPNRCIWNKWNEPTFIWEFSGVNMVM